MQEPREGDEGNLTQICLDSVEAKSRFSHGGHTAAILLDTTEEIFNSIRKKEEESELCPKCVITDFNTNQEKTAILIIGFENSLQSDCRSLIFGQIEGVGRGV